jgi:uncharacterized phage protein (TIGR01671 family)
MSRVIKFRGWDNERKVMRYRWLNIVPDSKYARVWGDHDEDLDGANNDVAHYINEPYLMQFTGLLDKNGKEIYEGDIVEGVKGAFPRSTVTFLDGGFQIGDDWAARWRISHFDMEIIGNIYENPEMLTT